MVEAETRLPYLHLPLSLPPSSFRKKNTFHSQGFRTSFLPLQVPKLHLKHTCDGGRAVMDNCAACWRAGRPQMKTSMLVRAGGLVGGVWGISSTTKEFQRQKMFQFRRRFRAVRSVRAREWTLSSRVHFPRCWLGSSLWIWSAQPEAQSGRRQSGAAVCLLRNS